MVDAAASPPALSGRTIAAAATVRREALTATVAAASDEALAAYARFAATAIHAPPQDPLWVECWRRHVNADAVVATILRGSRPILAMVLEIVRAGPFKVTRFPGGSHANGNFPALLAAEAGALDAAVLRGLFAQLRAVRPDVHAVALERLLPALGGHANPLLVLPSMKSPEPLLAVDLAGGFDAVLERTSAKRKRKKHRSQTRKFEEAGGFRVLAASDTEAVDRLLDAFFVMKADRLRRMGVRNVFADRGIEPFFRALFGRALVEPAPSFALQGLEVDGRLRAVIGTSCSQGRQVCEFGAIADDDLAHASPGDFLFYESIKAASGAGFDLFDFSVGDEPYKRLWCNLETWPRDVVVPIGALGFLPAGAMRLRTQAKTAVKANARLWSLLKRARRKTAGRPEASEG